MKYTININQEKLVKLEPNCRLTDAVVLDYVYWICASPSSAIESQRVTGEDGIRYTWLDYEHLLKEMPLLRGKTKATITPNFKRLEDMGFVKTMHGQGFRKYVCITEKAESAFSNLNASVNKTKRQRLENETLYKEDPNTSNHNTTIKGLATQSVAGIPELIKVFESVNPAISRMYGNKTQRASAENLIKKFGFENSIKAAQAAINILGRKFAPRITTPYELETNWAKLVAFVKENKSEYKPRNFKV